MAAMRKGYRLVSVMCMGVLLLGSIMAPPAFAQNSDTNHDKSAGSCLVFPIFDDGGPPTFGGNLVVGPSNQTKIRITNNGVTATRVRVTYICQPLSTSTTSAFCPSFDEAWPLTPHQTIVLDVGTELAGA